MRKPGLWLVLSAALWLSLPQEAAALAMDGMSEPGDGPMALADAGPMQDASLACLPCLRCPVAPAPASQTANPPGSFQRSGGSQPSRNTDAEMLAQAGVERALAVPLRIALCRWLN